MPFDGCDCFHAVCLICLLQCVPKLFLSILLFFDSYFFCFVFELVTGDFVLTFILERTGFVFCFIYGCV